MRDYGVLQCSFWQSEDVQSFTDAAKLLAAYLVTGPHSNGIGCYRLPDGYVMADFGWSADKVTKAFDELYRKGFAYRFDTVVFLPKFLRWNTIANPKVAAARQKEFDTLPNGEAKSRVARALLEFGNHIPDGFKTVLETVSQTVSETVCQTGTVPIRSDPVVPEQGLGNGIEHEAIIAVYHEVLPDLPAVRVWNDTRRGKLNARIADGKRRGKPADTIEYWRGYFLKVSRSDWLCGRKSDWRCPGLEWLVEESNFLKVIEGSYDNAGGTHGRSFVPASTAALS